MFFADLCKLVQVLFNVLILLGIMHLFVSAENLPTVQIVYRKAISLQNKNDEHSRNDYREDHLGKKQSAMMQLRSQEKRDMKRNVVHFVHRDRCNTDIDCGAIGTKCDQKLRQCFCPKGYIPKEMRSNANSNKYSNKSHESMFCFKPSQIGEECASKEQCFVRNSLCKKDQENANKNETFCMCEDSYLQEDGTESVVVNGITLHSQVICRYYNQGLSTLQVNVLITVGSLTLIVIFICLISYWKMKSNKRSMNIMTTIAMANSEPNESLNTNGVEVNRDLSNLPPIGSAEAEFQNDFIPVFPMHHLKPCPEKNTTYLNMRI